MLGGQWSVDNVLVEAVEDLVRRAVAAQEDDCGGLDVLVRARAVDVMAYRLADPDTVALGGSVEALDVVEAVLVEQRRYDVGGKVGGTTRPRGGVDDEER